MKYSVDNIDEVVKWFEDKSSKALKECWLYLEWKLIEEIKNDSYDTWHLARSINTQQVSKDKVIVWTNLEYALVREYWRRPWKFPPLDALVGWTYRKWMISWWATKKYDELHYEDKWVVFVIARAIARRGIQWKHTFQRVITREIKNISDLYISLVNKW